MDDAGDMEARRVVKRPWDVKAEGSGLALPPASLVVSLPMYEMRGHQPT